MDGEAGQDLPETFPACLCQAFGRSGLELQREQEARDAEVSVVGDELWQPVDAGGLEGAEQDDHAVRR